MIRHNFRSLFMSRLRRILGYNVPGKVTAAPADVMMSDVVEAKSADGAQAAPVEVSPASSDQKAPISSQGSVASFLSAVSSISSSNSIIASTETPLANIAAADNHPPLTKTHAKVNMVLPWYEYRSPPVQPLPSILSTSFDTIGQAFSSLISTMTSSRDAIKAITAHTDNLPSELSRVVVIGVHGWFPMKMMQKVLGEPTGTSQKFCDQMTTALQTWVQKHYDTSIPLSGLHKIPLEVEDGWTGPNSYWHDQIQHATTIFIATHSQGTPVSVLLLERLIHASIIDPVHQRIVVLAQAGISHGPFPYMVNNLYVRYLESDAARQLFEFNNPTAAITKQYYGAMERILDQGVKVVFVSSWMDQVVPLYSSAFHAISHPNLYRSVFIDSGNFYENDFLPNLVVFAIKLRNYGLSDYDLLVHLSSTVAGSLYSGTQGHSTLYEDIDVYTLAINFLLSVAHDPTADEPPSVPFMRRLTQSLYIPFISSGRTETPHASMKLQMQDFYAPTKLNPYYLPWILHSIITDESIRAHPILSRDLHNLVDMFSRWEVGGSTVRKELKHRLEPLVKARL